MMTLEEIKAGLNKGRVLHLDGGASRQEREAVQTLIDKGFAKSEFIEGDQYSYFRITKAES